MQPFLVEGEGRGKEKTIILRMRWDIICQVSNW